MEVVRNGLFTLRNYYLALHHGTSVIEIWRVFVSSLRLTLKCLFMNTHFGIGLY